MWQPASVFLPGKSPGSLNRFFFFFCQVLYLHNLFKKNLFIFCCKFYFFMIMIFYFILLYKTDLVLPYIDTASTQGCNVHMIYIINTAIHCTWRLSREHILCCYQNEKIFSFPLLCLYKMTDVHWTYCGNHFLMYLSQIIMLYIINLYSAVCQLYLKTERKK